jgi:hypothetical protein
VYQDPVGLVGWDFETSPRVPLTLMVEEFDGPVGGEVQHGRGFLFGCLLLGDKRVSPIFGWGGVLEGGADVLGVDYDQVRWGGSVDAVVGQCRENRGLVVIFETSKVVEEYGPDVFVFVADKEQRRQVVLLVLGLLGVKGIDSFFEPGRVLDDFIPMFNLFGSEVVARDWIIVQQELKQR